MILATLFSVLSLTCWSAMVASQELQSNQAMASSTHIFDSGPIPTGISLDSGDFDLADYLTTYNLSIDAAGTRKPEKDIRLTCTGLSLYLAKEKPITYYLIGHCGSVYDRPHDIRCSYLDLDLCFVNVDGKIVPRKLGGFSSSCFDCTYYGANGSNMMKCNCNPGHDEDHLIESTVNLGKWKLLAAE
ncbi:hypothetical protein SLS62_001605 [Diatrype stigma]|uniref:Cyanovirin-N domain-containing protein n=1 Tax=Diatrype stigma TaxID=117547 RepID=A0AAN9YVX4_9PEZI